MLFDLWFLQEKVILMGALALAILPYIFVLRKLILVRLNNYIKYLSHYPVLDKNKVLQKVFYCLINLYFLGWNNVLEDTFVLSKWVSTLKNLILASSTTITSILLVNALASLAFIKKNDANLILAVQGLKILSYCAITAVATHYVFGVSPYSLITSIGITAGFFVVLFKDAILGIIASVQCTLTDSLRIGDQIYFQQYDAEGIVENISPFMIRIRHLDGSTFTIPSHVLLSTCVKNFRDQGRKRNKLIKILLDISTESIRPINETLFSNISGPPQKLQEMLKQISKENVVANIFLFKCLVKAFLEQKKELNTISLKYGENKGIKLPLEISFFVESMDPHKYQDLKSEILEYTFCVANQVNVKFADTQ